MAVVRKIISFCFAALLFSVVFSAVCSAQTAETYRLRVENAALGRVEISVDGGSHYLLIGRVAKAAQMPVVDRGAEAAGSVLRNSGTGLAFSVAPGQALKLRPKLVPVLRKKRGKTFAIPQPEEPAAIVTNLEPRRDIFGDLAPPPRSVVRLQTPTGTAGAFPDSYAVGEENVFVFLVALPDTHDAAGQTPKQRLTALSEAYQAGAAARAQANHRAIVSGLWTLRAKLPPEEPDPIVYVSYLVDDDIVATQNTAPFSFAWDSRQAANGEHLIEIRALNKQGVFVTRARVLAAVQNPPPLTPSR